MKNKIISVTNFITTIVIQSSTTPISKLVLISTGI